MAHSTYSSGRVARAAEYLPLPAKALGIWTGLRQFCPGDFLPVEFFSFLGAVIGLREASTIQPFSVSASFFKKF